MFHTIYSIETLDNYSLKLTFDNMEVRIFDLTPYLDKGIFQKLKDKNLFKTAKISFDTVAWGEEIDIDPETLYEDSRPITK